MPIDINVGEELKILEKLKERDNALIERMDRTWKYFRGDKFTMPAESGKWDCATTNRAQAEGWKIINILASAKLKLAEVMISTDKAKEREHLSYNELLVNGLLYTADRRYDADPELNSLQSQVANYRTLRGWGAYRLLVCEDDDGNPYLDVAVWDRRNVSYIAGSDRLLKAYNVRYANEQQVKDEYGDDWNGKADDNTGLVKIVDVWDCSDKNKAAEEAVIIDKEYVKHEDVLIGGQKIHYLPIRIKAGGAIPHISDGNTDNIAHVGEDYLVNNRNIIDELSTAMTFKKTRGGMETKMPFFVYYDSSKGDLPQEITDKDMQVKGAIISLDKYKGQDIPAQPLLSPGNLINQYHADMMREANIGGLSGIAFGETEYAMTAFGMNVINQNTKQHIWPFKLAMEQDYIWMAHEIVKQYKNGSYKKIEFEGYDSKFNHFFEKIDPKDVKEGRAFECSLIVDELADKAANIDIATKEVMAGLNSRRGAINDHNLAQDADARLKEISQEKARDLFNIGPIEALGALIEDYMKPGKNQYDSLKGLMLAEAIKRLNELVNPPQQPEPPINIPGEPEMGMPEQGRRIPATNRSTARMPQESIPTDVRNAARKKMAEKNVKQ